MFVFVQIIIYSDNPAASGRYSAVLTRDTYLVILHHTGTIIWHIYKEGTLFRNLFTFCFIVLFYLAQDKDTMFKMHWFNNLRKIHKVSREGCSSVSIP